MNDVTLPFSGLPVGWQVLFLVALAVIVGMFAWSCLLFVRVWRSDRQGSDAALGDPDRFLWVFVVPALNEEVTIRDSVERLLALPLGRLLVVVVDDGSDDATPQILDALHHPDLLVLRRDLPDARVGKAAALNHAYGALEHRLAGEDRASVIVTVVDADGRLDADAPARAAAHFDDPGVGGVQLLVRIYNRQRLLTWLQDVEFGVYGYLFQAGRNGSGTAGLGGNGQSTRLASLDDVVVGDGPWQDRLTEDQDLGLRMITSGWRIRQELTSAVHQQGLSSLRALFRQRTRWSQGTLQVMSLVGRVLRAPFPLPAGLEVLAYLFIPFWQTIVGASLIAGVALAITGVAPMWRGGPTWQLLMLYILAFGGTMLGCIAARRRDGPRGWLAGFLTAHVFSLYTWILWPVLLRAGARQLFGRRDWSKTAREPLSPEPSSP